MGRGDHAGLSRPRLLIGAFVLRVGLTGGVGCGKSTVADHFRDLGVPIIDSDEIARQVVAPGRRALQEIVGEFGREMLRDDGTLDRARLREIIFHDEKARRRLNAIVHPRVRESIERQAAALDTDYCIIVIPLLFEAGMTDLVDRILVVDCTPEHQLERLLSRDGMNRNLAEAMIGSQISRDQRLQRADEVVDNCSTLDSLPPQVAILHEKYRRLARQADA